ncbi:MAG: hypothetical protein QOJ07_1329, partial [Thermoleophilaceae bacterium]|nr:hypothetical protein [Thermoleophilaceae bacterium]
LVLGDDYRVSGSGACLQELQDTLAGGGQVVVANAEAPAVASVA